MKQRYSCKLSNGTRLNYSGESSDAGLAVSDGDLLRCDYGV